MKLLYVFNGRFPSERAQSIQIAKMCTAFSEAGFDVSLAATNRATTVTNESSYGELAAISITRVAVPDLAPVAGRWGGKLGACLYSLQRLAFALKVPLRGHDIIYGRDAMLLWLISWRTGTRQRIVYESHQAQYHWFVKRLLRKGVPMVVISEGIFDYYVRRGVPEAQMLVAHDGVDQSFFAPAVAKAEARQRLGLPEGATIAMYIGGFDAWKGVDTFFKASEVTDDVTYVAIGGSEAELTTLRAQYPKVVFLGQKPYGDLAVNQQAADILVIPNTAENKLSAEYTSPLKLFAHMTARKPLVVSDIPSLKVVLGPEGATYFTPDDPQELAETITKCLAHYDSLAASTQQLYERAKQFTWRQRTKDILNFIQQTQS